MAAVSQLLNQLIDGGYIIRTTNQTDRRVKLIAITEKGTHAVQESIKARHAWVDDLAAEFTSEEMSELYPAIKLLNERTHELLLIQDPKCVNLKEHSSGSNRAE